MLSKNIVHAIRVWSRQPSSTVMAILCLALGIGATTAMFSVIDAVLLRPLPYERPDRLVALWEENPERNWYKNKVSAANFVDWQEQSTSYDGMAAYRETPESVILTGEGEPERVEAGIVSSGYFRVLGVEAVLGRTFLPQEDWAGGGDVAVLSDRLWRRRFGGRPDLLGKSMLLSGQPVTIVGVAPAGFRNLPGDVDLWLTFTWDPDLRSSVTARRAHNVRAVARLKPGVSTQQASQELQAIARRLQGLYPETNKLMGAGLTPLREWVVGEVQLRLVILFGAVALVLLVACANMANFMLARGASRAQELAIRSALGADRRSVVAQLLTESLVLAFASCLVGLLLSLVWLQLLSNLGAEAVPRFTEVQLDGRVLAFSAVVAVLTGLIFGLIPALGISREEGVNIALRGGGGRSLGSRNARSRALLVVAEFALTTPLLIGAGLLVRSFTTILQVDTGFNTGNLLTAKVSLPFTSYSDEPQIAAFYRQLLPRLQALHGVEAAAASSTLPLTTEHWTGDFAIANRPQEEYGVGVRNQAITPDYFTVMEVPLRAGRYFNDGDDERAPRVVIVNEALVRRYFEDEDPVGRQLAFDRYPDESSTWWTIVGVVRDHKQETLTQEVVPEIYRPQLQWPRDPMSLLIRTSVEPLSIARALRDEVKAVDPALPIYDVRTMREVLSESLARSTFLALLLTLFAAIALLQATVGIYAVVAYSVSLRTQEIGIRKALGGQARDITFMVIKQGMAFVGAGMIIGLAAAVFLGRSMSTFLYRVKPFDPGTFALVGLTLGAVGLLACYLPARRAALVDPNIALRRVDM